MKNCWAVSGHSALHAQPTAFLRVYELISLINHSCRPNSIPDFDNLTGNAEVIIVQDLAPQIELRLNYIEGHWLETFAQRRAVTRRFWGFTCDCVDCRGPVLH